MPPRTRNQGTRPVGQRQPETSKPRTPAKRSRDETDDSNDETASKRIQSERVARFPFNANSNPSFRRSLNHSTRRNIIGTPLTPSRSVSKPGRLAHSARPHSKHLNQFSGDLPELKPTGVRKSSQDTKAVEPTEEQKPQQSSSPFIQPQTPSHQESKGGWFGSLKKIFSWTAGATEHEGQKIEPADAKDAQSTSPTIESRPSQDSTENEPASKSNIPERSNIFSNTPQSSKRERKTPTYQRRGRIEADMFEPLDDSRQPTKQSMNREAVPDFATTTTPGSNKRKLNTENLEAYQARNPGFGLDYDEPDTDVATSDDNDAVEDTTHPVTPVPNKTRTALHTPLKSALKSGNRSTKRARFDENLRTSKTIYGNYGHAGDYTGSTFKNPLDRDNSFAAADSAARDDEQSSISGRKSIFADQKSDNDGWRPTAANPRRGHFCVPDFYDTDPDSDMDNGSTPQQDEVIAASPPSTPRMSHAELPSTTPPTNKASNLNEENNVNGATEAKLNKARLDAQRYKPKDSSRLSSVTQARSRSSSPPGSTAGEDDLLQQSFTPLDADKENDIVRKPKILDNTIRGDDGMTEYGREHQYDDWAKGLEWPEPQTYEEAGVVSSFISDLLRKRWSADDDIRVHEFWQKEFDEVNKAMDDAKSRGLNLELIAGDA